MRSSSLLASLVLGVVCLHPLTADAQNTFISANTTLNASNPVIGNAQVGFATGFTNPTSPTVNLVSGGSVSGYINAFNSSMVNISGGNANDAVQANNNSVINFSGGSVDTFLIINDNSTLNVFGTGQSAFLVSANSGVYSQYNLSGTLSDGTYFAKILLVQNVQYGGAAHFTLNNTLAAVTPEPGSIALLIGLATTGAGFLSRRRRQQAQNAA